MDHLPCVRDPLHPPIDVPYVVLKEDVYDGLGLLDFPAEAKFDVGHAR